jgi:hypothetical protein
MKNNTQLPTTNRIIVDYKGDRKLILLGQRDRHTGECFYGGNAIPTWPYYSHNRFFNSQEDMLKWLNKTKGTEFEGFVVHFSDGSIFKFKSEDYMRLHRIIAQFTFKRVLEAVQQGEQEDIRKALPEELIAEFDAYVDAINRKVRETVRKVALVVADAPKESRKEFALYLQQFYKGTDVIKFAFKYADLGYDASQLMKHVLQSLCKDDFEVAESNKTDDN